MVLAVAELVECIQVPAERSAFPVPILGRIWLQPNEPERSFGDYTPGKWAWLLANVRPLDKPRPARGVSGLWDWDEAAA
jgi:hypothetical protein